MHCEGKEKIEVNETRQIILNDFHVLPYGGHAGKKNIQ